MAKLPIRIFFTLVAVALSLTACRTAPPPADGLIGTWYLNGGAVDLIWEFRADNSVLVHTWSGAAEQRGFYRHLQGDRVALDFGGDAASVVDIAVAGNRMMMTKPGGDKTMLERK